MTTSKKIYIVMAQVLNSQWPVSWSHEKTQAEAFAKNANAKSEWMLAAEKEKPFSTLGMKNEYDPNAIYQGAHYFVWDKPVMNINEIITRIHKV